jgi:type I restriction enzyme, R subunit
MEDIEALEKRLWSSADNLRANSPYASNEYFLPVMGLIFLRHAYSRYLAVKNGIETSLPKRSGKTRPLTREDFSRKGAIFLRPRAQFEHLVNLPDSNDRSQAVINAPETDPVKPEEELLDNLAEAIDMTVAFLELRNFSIDDITEKTGFARNKAIINTKEAVNENDETRKRFEIMAREVFKKFKACITIRGINEYRKQYDAINIIYKSLQEDRDKADIADIIRDLHKVVDNAIQTHDNTDTTTEDFTTYDINKIDFDRLRKEFERTPSKNTTVQNLKHAIEDRLHRMIQQNPLRTDFQKHFEQIVEEYNREKDRVTIENTFEELLRFVDSLDEESLRAMQEGLDEESLAIFDLLVKPDLSGLDIKQIKEVARELLFELKSEKLRIDNWREKQATRDDVKVEIANFLWNERTGLPKSYSEKEIGSKADEVYLHVFQQYSNEQSAVVYTGAF